MEMFNNHTQVQIRTELGLSTVSNVKTIDFLRSACVKYLDANPTKLGGENAIVEIDESLFRYKQKYHRGRQPTREMWVCGLIDISVNPKKISLHLVEDRQLETLLPIIVNVCRKDTIVHSDSWKSYNGIARNLRFTHKTVNHSEHFVNPNNGVHTQNIECLWNSCKYYIK